MSARSLTSTPRTVWSTVPSPVGRLAAARPLRDLYEAFFHAFPDLTLKNDEPLIDGHRVVLITRISGTDHGGFMGLQPTGRSWTSRAS